MTGLAHDARFAIRSLIARPSYSICAVLTLALGIGGCAAIFALVDAVLIRPLPYPDPGRIVMVFETDAAAGQSRDQVALGTLLLAGAGLLTRSFVRLLDVDPGFDTGHVLTTRTYLPRARYADRAAIAAFGAALLERTGSLPGVAAAGYGGWLPLSGDRAGTALVIEGRAADGPPPEVMLGLAGGDYFRAMGIPIVRGRAFLPRDAAGAPEVVVVNEALAGRLFPGEDPTGRRVRLGPNPDAPWATIVGVVGDTRHDALGEIPPPQVYEHFLQHPINALTLVVRTASDPIAAAPAVRSAVRQLDPALPVYATRTMEEIRARSVARPRFLMVMLALLAGAAILVAMVGLYGVVAGSVAQRTREFGVRMALGARRGDVLGMILREGIGLAAIGVAIGVPAAIGAGRLLSGMLYGVTPADPATYVALTALLGATAILAVLAPARRATRVDPITALRSE